jgi:hypothetical protein
MYITPSQYPSKILKVADIRIFLDYMSCMAGVLKEAESTHPLPAPGFLYNQMSISDLNKYILLKRQQLKPLIYKK